jgi:hypothetical protein
MRLWRSLALSPSAEFHAAFSAAEPAQQAEPAQEGEQAATELAFWCVHFV